jgi:hypothetical protein
VAGYLALPRSPAMNLNVQARPGRWDCRDDYRRGVELPV